MNIKSVIVLILVALVIIFVIQNTQVVEVQFLIWNISASRALMLFGTLLIGLIAGWVFGRTTPRKK